MSLKERHAALQPWLSLLVRLSIAGILIFAAVPKLLDLPQSVIAVRAYRLLPEAIVPLVGHLLPFVELVVAALMIAGAFTRAAAVVWQLMMAAFLVGVIWAWSQGLQIDCGCFGGGGELAEGEATDYPAYVAERVGFLALGFYLLVFPNSRYSVDGWMGPATYTEK